MLKKILLLIRRDGVTYTLKRMCAYTIAHSPLAYRLSFSYTDNTRLVFAPALLTYAIFANREARQSDIDLLKKYTPVGGVVLDVGGNIGSVAIAAADHVGPAGTVHVFEPSPKFFNIINKNVAVNSYQDRVTTHNLAVGASTDTVHLNEDVACLLYTSPSPRDRTRSRMPSSA